MKKLLILLFSIGMLLLSCQPKKDNKNAESDGVDKKHQIEIRRYEKAIFNLNPNDLRTGLSQLNEQYRFFLGNDWQDTMNLLRMYNFISDQNIRELYNLVIRKYPDTTQLQNDLQQAFNRIEVLYPERKMPIVFTYVSGLDVDMPVIYADSVLAISLDLYLGKDVVAYLKAGIPEYKINRFTYDYLMPACMHAVADSLVRKSESDQSLLAQMITAGKVLYFLDVILPDAKDEYKIGYTAEKLKWCSENEGNIWAFLIANQLLYSSDPQVSGKLMVDAPFTSGFVAESPGRLGEWVGWQIVRAYMSENSSVTLRDLMNNEDAQSILKGSKYKPKKQS
jgi:gliding motility-associated lipoprotein GldB